MTAKARWGLVSILAVAALAAVKPVGAIQDNEVPEVLLLVPDRYRAVEFAFNLARQRNVLVVSYRADKSQTDLLLHYWNGREWEYLPAETYSSGSFLAGGPDYLIILGDDTLLPPALAAAPAWCRKTDRLTSLEIGDLINNTGAILKFKDREWKWLAEQYKLKLIDQNAERRRYGKYGPYGKENKPAAPEAENVKTEAGPTSQPVQVAPVEPAEVTPTDKSTPAATGPAAPTPAEQKQAAPPPRDTTVLPPGTEFIPPPAEPQNKDK